MVTRSQCSFALLEGFICAAEGFMCAAGSLHVSERRALLALEPGDVAGALCFPVAIPFCTEHPLTSDAVMIHVFFASFLSWWLGFVACLQLLPEQFRKAFETAAAAGGILEVCATVVLWRFSML